MSGSRITIADGDRLPNVHPGDILRDDFLVGSEIPLSELAAGTGLTEERLGALLAGEIAVDAEINLRLARYLRMSEGFFLGLQNDYDNEEVKRSHSEELARIVPRAA